MPIDISAQKLIDAIVDNATTVRTTLNKIGVKRYIANIGVVTVSAGASNITITETDVDNNYTVLVEVSWNTTVWIDNKTSGGFRINFGTAVPSGGRTIRWVKVRTL
jgi:hypothetical protein